MNKTKIVISIFLLFGFLGAKAEYTVKQSLEQSQGGNLPNGSIQIRYTDINVPEPTPENWQPYESEYSPWINSGSIYNCTNWTPEIFTVNSGQTFDQTATDCQQDQTRQRQEREQEITSLVIRNKGFSIVENQTITTSSIRTSTGTRECNKSDQSYTQFYDNGSYVIDRMMWEGLYLRNQFVSPKNGYQLIYSFTGGGYIYIPENMNNLGSNGIIDIYSGICRYPI